MARFKWYFDPLSPDQLKTLSELDPLWQNSLDPHILTHETVVHDMKLHV